MNNNVTFNVHKRYRDVPTVQTPLKAVDTRRSTETNLSNLLNLLIALGSARSLSYGNELIGGVSSFFDHIFLQCELNPVALIKELKALQTTYLGWIRGGALPSGADTSFLFLQGRGYSETERALAPLLALQYRQFGTLALTEESAHLVDIIFSCIQSYRVIVLSVSPNFDSITNPPTGTYKLDELKTEIRTVLKNFFFTVDDFKERLERRASKWAYQVTTKGGPNGRAIMACTADARALLADSQLADHLLGVCEHMSMTNLFYTMAVLGKTPLSGGTVPAGDPVTGRLIGIEEWGGKCRVVATLDYWTQTALRPLHEAIGDFLRRMAPDAAYDQLKAARMVKGWSASGSVGLSCFDLTTATDRLPVEVQEYILGILTGSSDFAKHWRSLLTSRSYRTPDGRDLKYSVGQPMGALSSFAVFDLSHHVLVQVAAQRAKVQGLFTDYVIIGDDVAINSSEVAAKYQILMESLGLSIDLTKSLIPGEGLLSGGEIAKRIFIQGRELTTIPVKLLAKLPRFGRLAPLVQDFLGSRGGLPLNKSMATFLMGAVDKESMLTLLKLNAVPPSISGMKTSFGTFVDHFNLKRWVKDLELTEADILDAYLFTTISEQLKRLDALLRESAVIGELLRVPALHGSSLATLFEGDQEDLKALMKRLLSKLPSADVRHPIVVAAFAEARRVSRVLAQLRAGTLTLSEVARRGLLDSLRNSIWTKLDMSDEDEAQALYTNFLATLTNVERICRSNEPRNLEFTIPLISLSRSFTVNWRLGTGVFVNSVKTRIVTDQVANETSLDVLLRETSVLRRSPTPKDTV